MLKCSTEVEDIAGFEGVYDCIEWNGPQYHFAEVLSINGIDCCD